MLLKFITALAWLWLAFTGLGLFVMALPPHRNPQRDLTNGLLFALLSIPAAAWLLARYVL